MATDVTEAKTTNLIGEPVKRVEDPRLFTGSAKYLDDLKLTNMAHVAILRSPYAHARIDRIDTARAEGAPGVIAVYTGADFEDLPALPCAWQAGGVENFVATPRSSPRRRPRLRTRSSSSTSTGYRSTP
jgi:carbon-monoxide dehydrogenase large subunit